MVSVVYPKTSVNAEIWKNYKGSTTLGYVNRRETRIDEYGKRTHECGNFRLGRQEYLSIELKQLIRKSKWPVEEPCAQ